MDNGSLPAVLNLARCGADLANSASCAAIVLGVRYQDAIRGGWSAYSVRVADVAFQRWQDAD
jgi:hypothetical protein